MADCAQFGPMCPLRKCLPTGALKVVGELRTENADVIILTWEVSGEVQRLNS